MSYVKSIPFDEIKPGYMMWAWPSYNKNSFKRLQFAIVIAKFDDEFVALRADYLGKLVPVTFKRAIYTAMIYSIGWRILPPLS